MRALRKCKGCRFFFCLGVMRAVTPILSGVQAFLFVPTPRRFRGALFNLQASLGPISSALASAIGSGVALTRLSPNVLLTAT
jgi:hypothetical protein